MPFKPSIKLTLLLLALMLGFLRLGWWQTERKAEKEQLFVQFDNAPVLGMEQALEQGALFARVEARGHYDAERHVLLDNKILNGRAGVHVLTPFNLDDGTRILVNRGWLPIPPDRRSLPEISGNSENRVITGILNQPPAGGPRIGDPDVLVTDQWPQLVTYLELDAVANALGTRLEPWILQLDSGDTSGFEGRQWKAAVMEPEVHGAYALQWYALAAAALIIWITLGVRRAQNARLQQTTLKNEK